MWNCNIPTCVFHCQDVNCVLEPAQGVFLCPQCQAAELLPISVGDRADETQLQCYNCGHAIYMFETVLVYSRLGRFQEEKLGWAIGWKMAVLTLRLARTWPWTSPTARSLRAWDVDPLTTYAAIRGLTSVVTMHVISRRMILTNNADGFWCAVNVSKVPGDDRYSLSSPLNLSATWWMLILRMKLLWAEQPKPNYPTALTMPWVTFHCTERCRKVPMSHMTLSRSLATSHRSATPLQSSAALLELWKLPLPEDLWLTFPLTSGLDMISACLLRRREQESKFESANRACWSLHRHAPSSHHFRTSGSIQNFFKKNLDLPLTTWTFPWRCRKSNWAVVT